MTSVETKSFNRDAQSRIAAMFRTCPPAEFLSELESYAPRSASEHVTFHKYMGWAFYDSGDYDACRQHLLQTFRLSDSRSADRSLALGILASTDMRTGRPTRGTRTVLRAISEGCSKDPGHFLEAGHLLLLGQVRAGSGCLTQALEMYDRALSLVDEGEPHWIPILMARAKANLFRGNLREMETDCREARRSEAGRRQQAYVLGEMESSLALAQGEVDRADEVVSRTVKAFSAEPGDRIHALLAEMQAAVLNARGQYRESEQSAQEILNSSTLGGRNSEAVGGASCLLAESLMGQGRFEEALEATRLAAAAGRRLEWKIWAEAFRLQAQCYAALGAKARAERAVRRAMSIHAFTQFDAERRRLDETIGRHLRPSGAGFKDRPRTAPAPRVQRLALRSGRVLVSCGTQVVEAILDAAQTDLPVLIEGETGTGKELAASLIHELSPRSSSPLVVIDCSSLPESLADAELFGATRGAYTGAVRERAGLIAQADRGTLVLDELPELSTFLQAKLLRVIQEGAYRRVGESQPRRVQIRFIATANQDVSTLLRSGALRADLFYRLGGHRIVLLPLRARREDIAPIAIEVATRSGMAGISADALEFLKRCPWPGNVRQLEMVVRVAASSCRPGAILSRGDVEPHIAKIIGPIEFPSGLPSEDGGNGLRGSRLAAERATLERALFDSGGSVTEAARVLGVSRQSFYKAMRRAGVRRSPVDR